MMCRGWCVAQRVGRCGWRAVSGRARGPVGWGEFEQCLKRKQLRAALQAVQAGPAAAGANASANATGSAAGEMLRVERKDRLWRLTRAFRVEGDTDGALQCLRTAVDADPALVPVKWYGMVLSMLAERTMLQEMRGLLNMAIATQSVSISNYMLGTYLGALCRSRRLRDALRLLDFLREQGLRDNPTRWNELLEAVIHVGDARLACAVIGRMHSGDVNIGKELLDATLQLCCARDLLPEAVVLHHLSRHRGLRARANVLRAYLLLLRRTGRADLLPLYDDDMSAFGWTEDDVRVEDVQDRDEEDGKHCDMPVGGLEAPETVCKLPSRPISRVFADQDPDTGAAAAALTSAAQSGSQPTAPEYDQRVEECWAQMVTDVMRDEDSALQQVVLAES